MILVIARWKIDITRIIFDIRLKYAVRKANKRAELLNKKHLVVMFNDKPRVYMKEDLKDLIRRRVIFRKGTTIQQIEKMAYYKTK